MRQSTLNLLNTNQVENAEGKKDFVRLFFGAIAAVYFLLVLLKNVLGINLPGLGN